jgi:hypothetical protein
MIISHSRKYIFIHLEKCGGTSIESILDPYLDFGDISMGSSGFGETMQEMHFRKYGIKKVKENYVWKHSDAKDAYKFLGKEKWETYKKIAVVRDPRDLIASLYFFSKSISDKSGFHDKKWLSRMFEIGWKDDLSKFPIGSSFIIEYCRYRRID